MQLPGRNICGEVVTHIIISLAVGVPLGIYFVCLQLPDSEGMSSTFAGEQQQGKGYHFHVLFFCSSVASCWPL